MAILCIDSSTTAPVVAIVDGDGTFLRGDVIEGRAQSLLATIDELAAAEPRPTLTGVVVGVGPGGFTGLRVGVATARGIAEALGIPLRDLSSLEAAAAWGTSDPGGEVVASIHAGRGERFVQRFRMDDDGLPVARGPITAVAVADAPEPTPITPRGLARAAAVRWSRAVEAGEPGDPATVLPRYGRDPDATPPRMEVMVDEVVPRDLEPLLVIERRCFPDSPWSRGMYEEELARAGRDLVALAARERGANDRLVGAVFAARLGDCWHVLNVLVDPSARGRGIGRRLVREMLDRTQQLGMGEGWTLEVRDGNDPAIALYEGLGFTHAGRRPGYYEDTGEDALVMWRREPAATTSGGVA